MDFNNNEYINLGKEVIKLINKNGAEGYFVGEFAFNVLSNRPFDVVEIFTTATNAQLKEIFSNYPIEVISEDDVLIKYMGFDFAVSTYKPCVQKTIIKPVKRHYSKALMDYLERKDFIINSMAINYSNSVVDIFDAQKDIKKKKVKMIGKPKVRFNESPVRMLKAINLVSKYGLYLDVSVYKGIDKRKNLLKKLSSALIAVELKEILRGEFAKRAVRLLYDTGMFSKMGVFKNEIKRLATRYKEETFDEFLINAFLKNGEIEPSVLKCADNEKFVKDVFTVSITNPKSDFDVFTLYRNGLDVCLAANKANYLVKHAKRKYDLIKQKFDELVIKSTCDLEFKGQDILKITEDGGGEYLIQLMEEIESQVLLGELANDYEAIRVYVYKRLYEMNSTPSKLHAKIEEVLEQENNTINTDEPKMEEEVSEEVNISIDDGQDKKEDFYTNELEKIEIDELESALNKEIEDLINKSQVLDGLTGIEAVETYKRMKDKYREALIEKNDKYKKLKDR